MMEDRCGISFILLFAYLFSFLPSELHDMVVKSTASRVKQRWGWVVYVLMFKNCSCHIFFTHSSIKGHLGYFYIWAIVNNISMDTGFRYLPKTPISFPLDAYLEVQLHVVVLFSFFF